MTKDLNAFVGDVLKGEYKKRGQRLEDLAPIAGIPYGTLRRKIAGGAPILASELIALSAAIGVAPAKVVEEALELYGGIDKLMSEVPPTQEPSNVITFERPDTTAEFEAYQGPQAAHPFEEEADEPEND